MNQPSVRIALFIRDRVAQQLTCSMLGAAGANVLVCEDATAIQQAADGIQAIVLGLTGSAEDTIDAIVMLRKRSAAIPIYVVADTAGQRHSKRIRTFGVTQVIAHAELQQCAAQLVKQLEKSAPIENWAIPMPGWAADTTAQGYDVESMDLNAWLSIPGNRRLLGGTEPFGQADAPATATERKDPRLGTDRALPTQAASTPLARAAAAPNGIRLQSPGAGQRKAPDAPGAQPTCGPGDCPHLIECREHRDAQNRAFLDAHKHREKRLEAEIKSELYNAMTERIAESHAKALQRMDDSLAEVRREIASAIRRMNVMMGGLVGLAVVVVLGFAWRVGIW
jgi:hypothetical protein